MAALELRTAAGWLASSTSPGKHVAKRLHAFSTVTLLNRKSTAVLCIAFV